MRIQPQLIEIPKKDPFENDLLGRKEPVEILTGLFHSVEGPCVLAVDAPWGAGKTTFLRMLAGHLQNHTFPVVNFNAWETDFTGDPFLSLSEELTNGLREYTAGSLDAKIDKVRKAATEVLRLALPSAIRLATANWLDIRPTIEKEVGNALASVAQVRLAEYLDARNSLQKFRTSLEELATDLAHSHQGRPLIVVIDELDRCRPSYAVELLETAKHLFSVDRVVFVLAVNGSELAHSVRAVYGSDFDASGYLRRFFDIDFQLPDVERDSFINATLQAAGIDALQQEHAAKDVRALLTDFLVASDVSLRSIAQSVHRLCLVFASVRQPTHLFALAATVALIVRTINPDLYRKFVRGEVDERNVIEFLLPRGHEAIGSRTGHFLEASIIAAAMEIRYPNRILEHRNTSPLLKEYQELTKQQDEGDDLVARARGVVNAFNHLRKSDLRGNGQEFREAVRRIEFLSPSLINNDAETRDIGHRDGGN